VRPDEVIGNIIIKGDYNLGKFALNMVSVMA
jgi:hypothetical protein